MYYSTILSGGKSLFLRADFGDRAKGRDRFSGFVVEIPRGL